jgi:hypothetical protein
MTQRMRTNTRIKDGQMQIAIWRFQMEAVVTTVLLVASLCVILFGHGNPNQPWAVSVVSSICGYWLHSGIHSQRKRARNATFENSGAQRRRRERAVQIGQRRVGTQMDLRTYGGGHPPDSLGNSFCYLETGPPAYPRG